MLFSFLFSILVIVLFAPAVENVEDINFTTSKAN